MSDMSVAQKDKLMADLRVVIADAEDLLRLGVAQTGASATEWRGRVEARLAQAKVSLVALQDTAVEKVKAGSHAVDEFVHDSPWTAVGAAAGIGLLIGLLIGRR